MEIRQQYDPLLSNVRTKLKRMKNKQGWWMFVSSTMATSQSGEVFLSMEPRNRQRLDHFVGSWYDPSKDQDPEGWDEEGWDEEGWQMEYAEPLVIEVTSYLEGLLSEEAMQQIELTVGEKGFLLISKRKP